MGGQADLSYLPISSTIMSKFGGPIDTIFGIGCYPKEYNPKVHGAFNAAVYYGKPDTPFKDVKLGELGAWIDRRQLSGIPSAISRASARYMNKYVELWKPSHVPVVHWCASAMFIYWAMQAAWLRNHRHHKYHCAPH